VTGPADDVLMRVILRCRGVAYSADQDRIERARRKIPELLNRGSLASAETHAKFALYPRHHSEWFIP
jgi:hypothetical protein